MLKRIGKATGKITLDIIKGAANNAAFGFGAMAALCLVYGTYSWGQEVGYKHALEAQASKEEASCPDEAEVTANE